MTAPPPDRRPASAAPASPPAEPTAQRRTEAEFLAWLPTAIPAEIAALCALSLTRPALLAAQHYPVSRFTPEQLGRLRILTNPRGLTAVCRNPDLTREQAEYLVTRALADKPERLTETLVGLVEAFDAAGESWVRTTVVNHLRCLLEVWWRPPVIDGVVTPDPSPTARRGACIAAYLALDWFGITPEHLAWMVHLLPHNVGLAERVVSHPAAPDDLVQLCLTTHGHRSLVPALATNPLVGARPALLRAVLADRSAATLPLVAPHCTDAQLRQQIADLTPLYSGPQLLAMFEALPPAQLARLAPEDLLPLLEAPDADRRVAGQLALGLLPARPAGVRVAASGPGQTPPPTPRAG